MSGEFDPNALTSAGTGKTYTTSDYGAADVNLVAEKGSPARRVRISTAGSGKLKVQYENGDTQDIDDLAATEQLDIRIVKILSGSNVGKVQVWW